MEIEICDRFSALSHPGRLSVFRLLMRRYPDALSAGEICAALSFKPSTASVYLSALRLAGFVHQNRQGTSLLYKLDLGGAQGIVTDLFANCCRGRPDLCPPGLIQEGRIPMSQKTFNVLFICTGNSARSIFAEAILRHEASDRFVAYSAGTKPYSELNPFAIEMLKSKGIDTTGLRAKTVEAFRSPDAPQMDFVFTVCDLAANEECPPWPGQALSAHWGLPDPVAATGTDAQKRLAFQQTFGAMRNRIQAFTALPIETLDRASLQTSMDDIGRVEPVT